MQLPTVDGMQDMEYDKECDIECAMRHAMTLINNGEGVDQIAGQRVLLSIESVEHTQ